MQTVLNENSSSGNAVLAFVEEDRIASLHVIAPKDLPLRFLNYEQKTSSLAKTKYFFNNLFPTSKKSRNMTITVNSFNYSTYLQIHIVFYFFIPFYSSIFPLIVTVLRFAVFQCSACLPRVIRASEILTDDDEDNRKSHVSVKILFKFKYRQSTYKSYGAVEIAVREDDERRLSSEFQRHFLHVASGSTSRRIRESHQTPFRPYDTRI